MISQPIKSIPFTQMRQLMKLAGPIIIAQLMQCLNSIVDTVMAGWHSPETLSQVAMGAGLWIPLLIFSSGVFSGASALSSHAFGAGSLEKNRVLLNACLVLSMAIAIVCVALLQVSPLVLPVFRVPEHLVVGIGDYVQMVALGFPALLFFWALRGWVEGLHKTRMAMIASLIAVLLNIPLNWIFIHGWWFIPSLGAKGCGIATAIASSTLPLTMLWLMRRDPTVRSHNIRLVRFLSDWSFSDIRDILRIGGPVGCTGFVEGSFFSVIAIGLAPLGTISVAAHQITLNISSMLFMVPLGMNYAITVAVGKALGEKSSALELRRIVHSGLYLGLIFSLCSCATLMILMSAIPKLYTSDLSVQLLATELLFFAALFQIPDSAQVCIYGVLKGLQDTLIPMFIGIGAYWLFGATLGYCFTYLESFGALGAKGAWIGLNIGLAIATLAFGARLVLIFKRVTGESVFHGPNRE